MKLVHTSDWHLGVTLGRVDRAADHEEALAALVALVEAEQPDLVLHTGDLFDRALPAADDLHRAATALARLAAVAPVLVLAGNHDSRSTFGALDRFAGLGGGRVRLLPKVDIAAPLLTYPVRGGGRLRVAAVPFLPLAVVGLDRLSVEGSAGGAYADRVRTLYDLLSEALREDRRPDDVDVLAAHLHVAGAHLTSEKRVHVSDATATDAAALPPVSYAAFGHLHEPQPVPGSLTGRYAGSIIPIDFGEEGQRKGAVVVSAAPGRAPEVRVVPLAAGRPLLTVRGDPDQVRHTLEGLDRAIVRVRVAGPSRRAGLAAEVAEWLPEGVELYEVAQETPGPPPPPPPSADVDDVALLRQHAAARGLAEADVEALVALWHLAEASGAAATAEEAPDLTGGAAGRLTGALAAASAPGGLGDARP